MVHRRLLRHLHLHDHALHLDLPHHHVRHLLHDDCVLDLLRDHVPEILRLLTRPRHYCLAALPYFLPGPHGRLHNHLHHLATDSHP